jgi:hypothetical protein
MEGEGSESRLMWQVGCNEATDEKLGRIRTGAQMIRDLAGWLSHEEEEELRKSVAVFDHDFS